MCSRSYLPRFVELILILLLLAKAIQHATGILVIKDNGTESNTSNFLNPNVKLNSTVITDNSIDVSSDTEHPTANHKNTNTSKIITTDDGFDESFNSSQGTSTEKSSLPTTPVSTNYSTSNLTTIAPPPHHKKSETHNYKILLYILIPVSAVLLIVGLYCMVRRIQRVKRKRRLERELTHQYSYPNSEAGDFDDEQRFLEVESIINTQFYAANDPEEKNFVAEIPQVSVAIGEGAKLVIEEESPLMDSEEASTSFNC